jgi:1-aminocyclopropane-1-carboxylate deaminase/D-cysteine desulfhydrase-like pyridoxal-dependent ACC family enzyme
MSTLSVLPLLLLLPLSNKVSAALHGDPHNGIVQVAKETGILLDPIYSLAAWEVACKLASDSANGLDVLLLHTGGTLGLHGLAQRFPEQF